MPALYRHESSKVPSSFVVRQSGAVRGWAFRGAGAGPAQTRRPHWLRMVWQERALPPDPGRARRSRFALRRGQRYVVRGGGVDRFAPEIEKETAPLPGLSENAGGKRFGCSAGGHA